jgi:hypothetical protein
MGSDGLFDGGVGPRSLVRSHFDKELVELGIKLINLLLVNR